MIILQIRDAKIYKLLMFAKNNSTISRLAVNIIFFSYDVSRLFSVHASRIAMIPFFIHHECIPLCD